jgi:CTP synthase (UTP-ammonia lyase)
MKVRLAPGSRVASLYGRQEVEEEFHCSYGLNPEREHVFDSSDLRIVGRGDSGEARVVELAAARFYLATLYLPQLAPATARPHPVIRAFIDAIGGPA